MSKHRTTTPGDALGRQLAQALDDAPLPEGVAQRLALARETAVAAGALARETRLASEAIPAGAAGGASSGRRGQGRWVWLLSGALLMAGLVAVGQSQWMQQVLGVAQADAALLKDALPPNAYGDPGFTEYLDEKPEAETPLPEDTETVDK